MEKFADSCTSKYCYKEIFPEQLERIRSSAKYTMYDKLPDSSKQRVVISQQIPQMYSLHHTVVFVSPVLMYLLTSKTEQSDDRVSAMM